MSNTSGNTSLSALTSKAKPYKAKIGLRLHLLIPSGSKLWRFRYWINGLHKSISLGPFPDTTLEQVISDRGQTRNAVKTGTNSSAIRKAERTPQSANAQAFRLVVALEKALTIEIRGQVLSLTPEKILAVRAIQLAIVPRGTSHAAN